jgi:hypothetical protein
LLGDVGILPDESFLCSFEQIEEQTEYIDDDSDVFELITTVDEQPSNCLNVM